MKTWSAFLAMALIALAGCGKSANSAGGECNLTQSPNLCLRCWAQKCAGPLDHCFGEGFHAGQSLSGSTAAPACLDYGLCIQACDCLGECFQSCEQRIQAACSDCQQMIFSPCRFEKCAAECSPPPSDGGP
jgi:hypothetical protein